ncbi:MAG: HAD family phosphatase [bacterium]
MPPSRSRPTHTIKNIVFDFGNVLVKFDYGILYRRLAQKSPLTVEEIHEIVFDSPEHQDFERGELSGPDFYRFVVSKTQVRMNYEKFYDVWADIFWPDEGMLDLADRLHTRYELYLLSNTNEIHYTEFGKVPGLMKIIPRHGVSFKFKAIKPEAAIYERFLKHFRIRAVETVFIDDIEVNARAARRIGMHAIHHTSLQSTRRGLARFGIVV